MSESDRHAGFLDGLDVIELSAFVAAPLAGLALAQFGANVIRVDPISGGLDWNRWPVTATGDSLYWSGLNRGKRSVQLDLASSEGRKKVQGLIRAIADTGVLLSNALPRWLDLGYLRETCPRLIIVILRGNNDGSPEVDYTVNAAAGFPTITGYGGSPINHVLPAWDITAAWMLATGILAADRHRSVTGRGETLFLSLSDAALVHVAHLGYLAESEINGAVRAPDGNHVYGTFGRDFETADRRRVMVVVVTHRQWLDLVRCTGTAEHMSAIEQRLGLDLSSEGDRYRARKEIAEVLEPWFRGRRLVDVGRVLGDARVLWGAYQSFEQLINEDPRCSTANPRFRLVDDPCGRHLTPTLPFEIEGRPDATPMRATQLGRDTNEVLGQYGVSESHD